MGGALLTCKKSREAVAPEHDAREAPRQEPFEQVQQVQQLQHQRRQLQTRTADTADNRPPRPRNRHSQQPRRAQKSRRSRPAGTPLRPVATATIDYTPVAKAERERFKYSCPLCFCYFDETILVTSCCGNYTCYSCSLDHAKQKGGVAAESAVLPARLKGVPCPHCNTDGVQFAYVAAKAEVRCYDTSPATKARMDKLGRLSFSSPRPLSPTEESRMEEEEDGDGAQSDGTDDNSNDLMTAVLASSASSMDIARSMAAPETTTVL